MGRGSGWAQEQCPQVKPLLRSCVPLSSARLRFYIYARGLLVPLCDDVFIALQQGGIQLLVDAAAALGVDSRAGRRVIETQTLALQEVKTERVGQSVAQIGTTQRGRPEQMADRIASGRW